MHKTHVTIHDIARELEISASTVSRALNNHPRISESTRMAVQELARKYNYQPNVVASSLRRGQSKTVGVIVPRINRNFFSNVIGGMEEVLAASGYHLMICQSQEKVEHEIAALQTLVNARADAIILSVSMQTSQHEHLHILQERGTRLFFFDRAVENLGAGSVVVDDRLGGYKAVKHLLEQGYRRIMHLGGPEHINVYRSRRQGYLDAMAEAGIDVDPAWIIEQPLVIEGGKKALEMSMPQKPDAFFCAGDYAALGVMHEARKRGISIPGDMGICGFANEPFTEFLSPSMTSLEQGGVEMGARVARMFLECIPGSKSERDCRKSVIEPELIIRESTMNKSLKTK